MVANTNIKFKEGAEVVYPSHGVGTIKGVKSETVVGMEIKTYVIEFEKEKMTLSVPVAQAEKSGLRDLSDENDLEKVSKILILRPKSSRGMWSRRAKEYEAKINSGNIVSVAEVVRDLHKNVDDPDRSYSERIIYENALERLSREVSAVKKFDLDNAQKYVVKIMNESNPYFIKKAQELKEKREQEEAKLNEDDKKVAKLPEGKSESEDSYDDEAIAA
jgi:CarD family transcriptional regulator